MVGLGMEEPERCDQYTAYFLCREVKSEGGWSARHDDTLEALNGRNLSQRSDER